ncbi:hypothetical protein E2C01_052065 [Portunus trituberculatus]|uniref:Secreted protein n=1 Tax=Portunus trituberculatus TaxID=210409 RepID=A0A5B7GCM3_PORTR|nr:hypothetical protein [Portunus trituberculatus]
MWLTGSLVLWFLGSLLYINCSGICVRVPPIGRDEQCSCEPASRSDTRFSKESIFVSSTTPSSCVKVSTATPFTSLKRQPRRATRRHEACTHTTPPPKHLLFTKS